MQGGEARFVGGAVRNHLMGLTSDDIDMAVNKPIINVVSWLSDAGLAVYETGIEHGTITVRYHEKSVELTQTRKDTQTDGRHAEVIAIDDWLEDAKRRDFSVNALYMDAQGVLFDPLDGAADIKAGRLTYIGIPDLRIKEDYLRILRGFRLMSEYPELVLTDESIDAAGQQVEGLSVLSGERITTEWMRLLAGRGWRRALQAAQQAGLDKALLSTSFPKYIGASLTDDISALARCAWLLGPGAPLPSWLQLSRPQINLLTLYTQNLSQADADALMSETGWQQAAYWLGSEARVRLILYLLWDRGRSYIQDDITARLAQLDIFQIPSLPLRGADLVKSGITPGPKLGKILKALEIRWVESEFQLNHSALMAILVKEYSDA